MIGKILIFHVFIERKAQQSENTYHNLIFCCYMSFHYNTFVFMKKFPLYEAYF